MPKIIFLLAVVSFYLYYRISWHIRRTGVYNVSQFQQVKSKKNKQSTNFKYDEINIINIINDNTFYLHKGLLNNNNKYMKVTPKFKLIGISRILNLHMAYKT